LISPGDIDTHEEKLEIYMMSSMLRAKYIVAIVLSVLLQYTDSVYPFGIFKLFFLQKL
jgi:hypothetical protein